MISLNNVMGIIRRWKNSIISLRLRFLEIPHKKIGCPEGFFLRIWVSKKHPDALLAKTMARKSQWNLSENICENIRRRNDNQNPSQIFCELMLEVNAQSGQKQPGNFSEIYGTRISKCYNIWRRIVNQNPNPQIFYELMLTPYAASCLFWYYKLMQNI